MTIRWGILSTASIGEKQLIPAIRGAEGAELSAVASRDKRKADEFAARLQIPKAYGSYEELLADPTIDAVYIPLPNHLHAEWTNKAAQQNKHVLCEKPAALNAEQIRDMIQVCKDHNVVFAEAFMYQYHAIWQRVHEIIEDGEIGQVKVVNACFSFPLRKPQDIRLNPEMGGGSLYDVGSYCVHAIRKLAQGAMPSAVSAEAHFADDGVVDLSLAAVLRFPNGMVAHFDSSFEVVDRQRVEIVGTEGSITIPLAFRPDKGDPVLHVLGTRAERSETVVQTPMYQRQVEDIGRAIQEGTQPLNTWEDSIQNMEILDAIYTAAGRKSINN